MRSPTIQEEPNNKHTDCLHYSPACTTRDPVYLHMVNPRQHPLQVIPAIPQVAKLIAPSEASCSHASEVQTLLRDCPTQDHRAHQSPTTSHTFYTHVYYFSYGHLTQHPGAQHDSVSTTGMQAYSLARAKLRQHPRTASLRTEERYASAKHQT